MILILKSWFSSKSQRYNKVWKTKFKYSKSKCIVNEQNKIYPLRKNETDCQNTIDLFLFEKDGKSHYGLNKNFSRLVSSHVSKDTNPKKYFYKKCLSHFVKEELFEKHITYCCVN